MTDSSSIPNISVPEHDESAREWIFTFGARHRGHSGQSTTGRGFRLDDRFVAITGTWQSSRERMFEIFGAAWSMQYEDREAAGVNEYGLTELVLTPEHESAVSA